MRILFSANPMFGHVNPLLPLAIAAARAGHTVLFATGADMTDHVRSHDIEATAIGPTYAAGHTDPEEPWTCFFARIVARRATELVPLARTWSPDMVIHDETELAGGAAAAVAGARHVVHGLGIPPPSRLGETLRAGIDDLGTAWDEPDVGGRLADATYIHPCPPTLEPQGRTFWSTVQPIRPTIPTRHRGNPPPWPVTGLRYPTSVHVTLGTVFNHKPPLLRAIVVAVAGLPVNVIVTTGPGLDTHSLGALPPNVSAHEYLPYDLLLPHCAAVVSHGGAGAMLASLARGLPQLLLPQGADQHGNADACVGAGAALSLVDSEVDATSVTAAVSALLREPSFTDAAILLRNEIETMPAPTTLLERITA